MNRVRLLLAGLFAAGVVGCGSSDPNKDLKPIDPNTKPPKPVTDGKGGGGANPADKPAPVIK